MYSWLIQTFVDIVAHADIIIDIIIRFRLNIPMYTNSIVVTMKTVVARTYIVGAH